MVLILVGGDRLLGKSKPAGKVVTAVARELVGFIWAIACQAEVATTKTPPIIKSTPQRKAA